MLHERPNESFHWKNKLDELDHLSGEPPTGKEAAWEKLQARLQEKPRAKKTVWYWMAAACLLLLAGVPWLMLNQNRNNLAESNSQQPPERPTSGFRPVGDPKETLTLVPKSLVNKQTTPPVTAKDKTHHPDHSDTTLKKDIAPTDLNTINESLPRISVISSEQLDTTAELATSPVKNRLKIVHVNELGDHGPDDIQYVENSSTPLFRTKPFRQDDHAAGISLSRNASDNIVKIKIAPSN